MAYLGLAMRLMVLLFISLVDTLALEHPHSNTSIRFRSGYRSKGITWEGRKYERGVVEMYKDGSWRPLCARLFNNKAANVTCRMLGFNSGDTNSRYNRYLYGQDDHFIRLGLPWCTGRESNIDQCGNILKGSCGVLNRINAIGVRCFTGKSIPTCATHRCPVNGLCYIGGGGPRCRCRVGFDMQGNFSCVDIDECARSPCSANATCSNNFGSYNCKCRSGFLSSRVNFTLTCVNKAVGKVEAESMMIEPTIVIVVGGILVLIIVVFIARWYVKRRANDPVRFRDMTNVDQMDRSERTDNTNSFVYNADQMIRSEPAVDTNSFVPNAQILYPPPSYLTLYPEGLRTGNGTSEMTNGCMVSAPTDTSTSNAINELPRYNTLFPEGVNNEDFAGDGDAAHEEHLYEGIAVNLSGSDNHHEMTTWGGNEYANPGFEDNFASDPPPAYEEI